MIALGITGTDTGVGKTTVARAIAAAFAQRGARVGVMKPVETGCAAEHMTDGALLAEAAASGDARSVITPYAFSAPVAPMVAAAEAGVEIDIGRLDAAFQAVSRGREVVIVEGAGGLLVPITRTLAFDALFARWRADVVIVAPNRLGVINHVRLTVAAARAAAATVRAIVLNDAMVEAGDASVASNAAILGELMPEIQVVRFPRIAPPCDHPAFARAFDQSRLRFPDSGSS